MLINARAFQIIPVITEWRRVDLEWLGAIVVERHSWTIEWRWWGFPASLNRPAIYFDLHRYAPRYRWSLNDLRTMAVDVVFARIDCNCESASESLPGESMTEHYWRWFWMYYSFILKITYCAKWRDSSHLFRSTFAKKIGEEIGFDACPFLEHLYRACHNMWDPLEWWSENTKTVIKDRINMCPIWSIRILLIIRIYSVFEYS